MTIASDYYKDIVSCKENYPWEPDHMFATKKLYDSLQKVEVHFNDAIEKVSGHNPIVAEFNL